MLYELIDCIYVYQAEGTGKNKQQEVEINYRFFAGSQCGIARWEWANRKITHQFGADAEWISGN